MNWIDLNFKSHSKWGSRVVGEHGAEKDPFANSVRWMAAGGALWYIWWQHTPPLHLWSLTKCINPLRPTQTQSRQGMSDKCANINEHVTSVEFCSLIPVRLMDGWEVSGGQFQSSRAELIRWLNPECQSSQRITGWIANPHLTPLRLAAWAAQWP